MFGMSTFWKSNEVSVADVFHLLMYARSRSIVAVDSHLFEQYEEPFQIGGGIFLVACSFVQRLGQGGARGLLTNEPDSVLPLLLDVSVAGRHHQVSKQMSPGLVCARRVIFGGDNHFHELVEKMAFLFTEEL